MTSRLRGKSAIVTGGASGIGRGIVEHLAAEGARVTIADIQEEAGSALAASLPGARFHRVDVTAEEQVESLVSTTVRDQGGLDIMVNNAGGIGARGSILELTGDDFDRTIALLLKSVFFGIKHAGRSMSERGRGAIINTASIAGLQPGAGPHLYATAKAAVVFLTKSAALELGEKGVRVNCVCPGGIATPMVLGLFGLGADAMPGLKDAMSKTQAIRRAGEPLDIGRAVAWLGSDDADYVTGQALAVDGGEGTGLAWSKQSLT
jgi:NAD(P)-dependent dehydrogenase (short-subunit alcohol dehydrogenase family)